MSRQRIRGASGLCCVGVEAWWLGSDCGARGETQSFSARFSYFREGGV